MNEDYIIGYCYFFIAFILTVVVLGPVIFYGTIDIMNWNKRRIQKKERQLMTLKNLDMQQVSA